MLRFLAYLVFPLQQHCSLYIFYTFPCHNWINTIQICGDRFLAFGLIIGEIGLTILPA